MTFKEFSANMDHIGNAAMFDNEGEFMGWESIKGSTPEFKKALKEIKKIFSNERYMKYFLFNWIEWAGAGISRKEMIELAFNVGQLL